MLFRSRVEGYFVRYAGLQANADRVPDRHFVGSQTGQQISLGALAPGQLLAVDLLGLAQFIQRLLAVRGLLAQGPAGAGQVRLDLAGPRGRADGPGGGCESFHAFSGITAGNQ